jgi:hypothetical protein
MTVKIAILGGCFPVQEQIIPEKLYHNLIKEKLLREENQKIEFQIYRYDSFCGCLEITKKLPADKPDCILLHIRPDPYLISSKIYLKYIDLENRKRKKINMHFCGFKEPEINPVNYGSKVSKNGFSKIAVNVGKQLRRIMRNFNYFAGFITGNNFIVKRKVLETINEIKMVCKSNGIKLIVQGPPMRPRSYFENILLKSLNKYLQKSITPNAIYIYSLYENDESGNPIFLDDKIHLNEHGHKLYANLLYKEIVLLYSSP